MTATGTETKTETETETSKVQVILVTGMSGAGKTSALKALEDMNFEAIDHVPLSLLEHLVVGGQSQYAAPGFARSLAIGVDIRTPPTRRTSPAPAIWSSTARPPTRWEPTWTITTRSSSRLSVRRLRRS